MSTREGAVTVVIGPMDDPGPEFAWTSLLPENGGDGMGNACDPDLNNDCVVSVVDLGIMRSLYFEVPGPAAEPSACAPPDVP